MSFPHFDDKFFILPFSNSDENLLRNIELFDKLSLRFNGRILFLKDISGNQEICCWSFYGHSQKIAEVCCTSIVYGTDKKHTKVGIFSSHPNLSCSYRAVAIPSYLRKVIRVSCLPFTVEFCSFISVMDGIKLKDTPQAIVLNCKLCRESGPSSMEKSGEFQE